MYKALSSKKPRDHETLRESLGDMHDRWHNPLKREKSLLKRSLEDTKMRFINNKI